MTEFTISVGSKYIYIYTLKSRDQLAAELKSLYNSGNPLIIIYGVIDATTTPLSAEELAAYRALTTYSGTTVVSTAEPVAGIEAQYIADGTHYLQSMDDRIAALEAAQTDI